MEECRKNTVSLGEGERRGKGLKKKGKAWHIAPLNLLPLLPSEPGGMRRELVVYAFPGSKFMIFSRKGKILF